MKIRSLFSAAGLAISLSVACAHADKKPGDMKPPPPPKMTKEQREQMAQMHLKMAECLRSDKDLKECHDQMHAACEQAGMNCPMMGGPGHHGMMHGHEHGKGE